MSPSPRFNLQRFIEAQNADYEQALAEIRRGRKTSHWIWYVFPQVIGLGSSSHSIEYAIRSREEALAYLEHGILGVRLRECASALLPHKDKAIEEIMGYPDDLKLRSSMTLFARVSGSPSVFHDVLDAFFAGERDSFTMDFLEKD